MSSDTSTHPTEPHVDWLVMTATLEYSVSIGDGITSPETYLSSVDVTHRFEINFYSFNSTVNDTCMKRE